MGERLKRPSNLAVELMSQLYDKGVSFEYAFVRKTREELLFTRDERGIRLAYAGDEGGMVFADIPVGNGRMMISATEFVPNFKE
jgi:hypothetical protein